MITFLLLFLVGVDADELSRDKEGVAPFFDTSVIEALCLSEGGGRSVGVRKQDGQTQNLEIQAMLTVCVLRTSRFVSVCLSEVVADLRTTTRSRGLSDLHRPLLVRLFAFTAET